MVISVRNGLYHTVDARVNPRAHGFFRNFTEQISAFHTTSRVNHAYGRRADVLAQRGCSPGAGENSPA